MDKSVRALVLETDLDTASPNGLESLCPAWSPKPPLVKSQRAAQIFGSRAGLWVQPQHRAENQTGAPDCRAPVTPLPGAGWLCGGVQVLEAALPLSAFANPPQIRALPDMLPTRRASG